METYHELGEILENAGGCTEEGHVEGVWCPPDDAYDSSLNDSRNHAGTPTCKELKVREAHEGKEVVAVIN